MSRMKQLLADVTRSLPGGGEERPGQVAMAEAIHAAISKSPSTSTSSPTVVSEADESDEGDRDEGRVVIVEAGTGTGKSLAYLTPIVESGQRAVVATATIALQGQLVDKDIPAVAEGLDRPVTAAVLKGRGNYLCVQQLKDLQEADRTQQLELLGGRDPDRRLAELLQWAASTETGDREELDDAPPYDVWRAVSVTGDECPGAGRCPSGDLCYSEAARQEAFAADIIVTNQHYYGLNISSGGALLGDHEIVVFDEAHQFPDILGATCGTELGGGRLRAMARRVRSILTDEALSDGLNRSADEFDSALTTMLGRSVEIDLDLTSIIVLARDRTERVLAELRKLDATEGSNVAARIERTTLVATRLVNDIDTLLESGPTDVVWVDGTINNPVLRLTPLELGPLLDEHLWPDHTVVMTSATLADGFGARLGLDSDHEVLRVGSPFDYAQLGLLYCPTDLPPPKNPDFRSAVQDELIGLIKAAGGRALALFTSYSAMTEAAERLRDELDVPVLVQGEGSKSALIQRFQDDPSAVLAATMSFWQGVDLPGSTLTLVAIDRIPFPRPDDPVLEAQRGRIGARAFREVDLPRAQILLAQAAGRLIRRSDDRGVVAVLDSRLANSRGYRWDLINALPPLRRTKDRQEVYDFLRLLHREAVG